MQSSAVWNKPRYMRTDLGRKPGAVESVLSASEARDNKAQGCIWLHYIPFYFSCFRCKFSCSVLFCSVHSRSARNVSSTVGSSRPMLGSLSMLSPSRLRGSIWRSSSKGNGVSASTLRLTSGMAASAPLRSLKRLELESSGRSGQQGGLGGVRPQVNNTADDTPKRQPRQWSPCSHHFQAHSSSLEPTFLPVGSTTPNFCRLSPLEPSPTP